MLSSFSWFTSFCFASVRLRIRFSLSRMLFISIVILFEISKDRSAS